MVKKAPGVFSRRHFISADLFRRGSEYLVKLVIESKKVFLNIVFPMSEMSNFEGAGKLILKF